MNDAVPSSPSPDAPSPHSSEPPTPASDGAEHGGEWVVIGLVVSLLTFMFITYSVGAYYLRAEDWITLVAPAARLTHSASFGLAAFCGVDAWRRGRNGWWLYVLAGGLPIIQWGVVVYWLAFGRKRERRIIRWNI